MTTSPIQALVREQAFATLASDVPPGMTFAEYRGTAAVPSRWERVRVTLLGLSAIGIVAHTLAAARQLR
jgi:hypothetical protein